MRPLTQICSQPPHVDGATGPQQRGTSGVSPFGPSRNRDSSRIHLICPRTPSLTPFASASLHTPLFKMANMHRDRQSRFSLLQTPDRNPARSSSIFTERSSTPSPTGSHSDLLYVSEQIRTPIILGVCAMDIKARSKAMREILTRLVERSRGGVEVKVFGDKVILDEGAFLPPFTTVRVIN